MNNSKNTNFNTLVISFLRKNRKALTREQICVGINTSEGLRGKYRLTPARVSKCLNYYTGKNQFVKFESRGLTSEGRKCSMWRFNKA